MPMTTIELVLASSCSLKALLLHFLLLSLTLPCAKSARLLSEENNTVVTGQESLPVLSFFMHDILGGSAPSVRVVAGQTSTAQTSNLPFSKPNRAVFPLPGGVPLTNLPFAKNRVGPVSTIIGKSLPFVMAGELPMGSTFRNVLFGTITVIDDEITEGREIGASVIGKAQGFHLASSLDGSSWTMAFTVICSDNGTSTNGDGYNYEDTISFFGVHRTAAAEKSMIAVVGGTGKYEDARGYTTVETVHIPDQHTTDGMETLFQFNVYLNK